MKRRPAPQKGGRPPKPWLDARQSELAFEADWTAIHDLLFVAVVVLAWATARLSPGFVCHQVLSPGLPGLCLSPGLCLKSFMYESKSLTRRGLVTESRKKVDCISRLHSVSISIVVRWSYLGILVDCCTFRVLRLIGVASHESISCDQWCRMAPGQSTARQHATWRCSFIRLAGSHRCRKAITEDGLRLHSFSFHVPLSQIIVDAEAHLTLLFLDWITRMV
jgi:hypothetical protein